MSNGAILALIRTDEHTAGHRSWPYRGRVILFLTLRCGEHANIKCYNQLGGSGGNVTNRPNIIAKRINIVLIAPIIHASRAMIYLENYVN